MKKKSLLIAMAAMSVAAIGAGTVSTMAWYVVNGASLVGTKKQALSVSNPNISLEAINLEDYISITEINEHDTDDKTSEKTLLLSYEKTGASSSLWTKYWDNTTNQAYDLPEGSFDSSTMTLYKLYKVSLTSTASNTEILNSLKTYNVKVEVENAYFAVTTVETPANDDGHTYYVKTGSNYTQKADITGINKANLFEKTETRSRLAIALTKADLSRVPGANAKTGNVTYTTTSSFDGSATDLAYICARVDGGSEKDTTDVKGDFTVKLSTVSRT